MIKPLLRWLLRPLRRWIARRTETACFRRNLQKERRERAHQVYNWLRAELERSGFLVEAQVGQDLVLGKGEFLKLFFEEPTACKVIEHFAQETELAIVAQNLDDMFILYNRAAMFSLLAQLSEDYGISEHLRAGFEQATSHSLRRFLEGAQNQIDALCRYLLIVRDAICKLPTGDARIFLLEMPTGNCLMVQCLSHLLGSKVKHQTIQISLTWNDSKNKGITRVELLKEKFRSEGVQPDDIIVHIDEWISGVNFGAICEQIARALPAGVFFLPLAVLAPSAPQQNRYQTFASDHDKRTKIWGGLLPHYRVSIPALLTKVGVRGEFFWSEKDRLAGCRKLQVHGAIFSSLNHTIELLHSDLGRFNATASALLARYTEKRDLPYSLPKTLDGLRTAYEDAYIDYGLCRTELERSADGYARGDKFLEVESGLEKIISGYSSVVNGRPVETALLFAGFYLEEFGPLDPHDRNLLTTHVPTVEILSGTAEVPHKVTMACLMSRCEALDGHP